MNVGRRIVVGSVAAALAVGVLSIVGAAHAQAQDESGFDGGTPPPSDDQDGGGNTPPSVITGPPSVSPGGGTEVLGEQVAPSPRGSGLPSVLAFTGVSTFLWLLLAGVFLVLGIVAWFAGRRGLASASDWGLDTAETTAPGNVGQSGGGPYDVGFVDAAVAGLDECLAELRMEMEGLRLAVDGVAERVEMRQLRSGLDDLRSDVAGLRRAVIDWPELERVSSEITALRADFSELFRRGDVPATPEGLASLAAAVERLREEVAANVGLPTLAPVLSEIGELRREVTSLRRRIALRVPDAVAR